MRLFIWPNSGTRHSAAKFEFPSALVLLRFRPLAPSVMAKAASARTLQKAVEIGKENPDSHSVVKPKDPGSAKRAPQISDIGNTLRTAAAPKAKPEALMAKNAIPLRKKTPTTTTGAATTAKSGIPRPVTAPSDGRRDWKKIHEQEEQKKQKRLEALKRPTTKPAEFAFAPARPAPQGQQQQQQRASIYVEEEHPQEAQAQTDGDEEFQKDAGALQSILANTGIENDALVRKSMYIAAAQTETHQKDIKEVVANLQALRARMSMHAGVSTTSLLQQTAAYPASSACSDVEPVTPGRAEHPVKSLAQMMLPSEKRRMTLAQKPVSPIPLAQYHTQRAATQPARTGAGDFVIHSTLGAESEKEQWQTAATFDTILTERETMAAKVAPTDASLKRTSIFYGAVRVPQTNKKVPASVAAQPTTFYPQSPAIQRASMYVPTPMQAKTPRPGADAAPVTPSVTRTAKPSTAAPAVPAATVPGLILTNDYLGDVPAGVDMEKYLDAVLAAEEAQTKALMESALALPKAAEKIAPLVPLVRTVFDAPTAIKAAPRNVVPAQPSAVEVVECGESELDAELAAITLLPCAPPAPARALVEPVSRQVEEPFDRIRPIAVEHTFIRPSSIFKAIH